MPQNENGFEIVEPVKDENGFEIVEPVKDENGFEIVGNAGRGSIQKMNSTIGQDYGLGDQEHLPSGVPKLGPPPGATVDRDPSGPVGVGPAAPVSELFNKNPVLQKIVDVLKYGSLAQNLLSAGQEITPKLPAALQPAGQAATGVAQSLYDVPDFLATPAGLASTVVGGVGGAAGRVVSGAFAAGVLKNVPQNVRGIVDAHKKGDWTGVGKGVADTTMGLVVGALGARGAFHETILPKQPEGSQGGGVGPMNKVLSQAVESGSPHTRGWGEKALKTRKSDLRGRSIDVDPNIPKAGNYDPQTGKTSVAPGHEGNQFVKVHEIVHVLTEARTKDPEFNKVVSELYEEAKQNPRLNGLHGMQNIDEFVAETATNPSFQQQLRFTRTGGRSIMGRFADGVNSVLGRARKGGSLLEKAEGPVEEIVTRPSVKAGVKGRKAAKTGDGDVELDFENMEVREPGKSRAKAKEVEFKMPKFGKPLGLQGKGGGFGPTEFKRFGSGVDKDTPQKTDFDRYQDLTDQIAKIRLQARVEPSKIGEHFQAMRKLQGEVESIKSRYKGMPPTREGLESGVKKEKDLHEEYHNLQRTISKLYEQTRKEGDYSRKKLLLEEINSLQGRARELQAKEPPLYDISGKDTPTSEDFANLQSRAKGGSGRKDQGLSSGVNKDDSSFKGVVNSFWLSNSGDLHEAPDHYYKGKEILGELTKDPRRLHEIDDQEEQEDEFERVSELMRKKGYVRVIEQGNTIFISGKYTSKQLKAAKDFAIERGKSLRDDMDRVLSEPNREGLGSGVEKDRDESYYDEFQRAYSFDAAMQNRQDYIVENPEVNQMLTKGDWDTLLKLHPEFKRLNDILDEYGKKLGNKDSERDPQKDFALEKLIDVGFKHDNPQDILDDWPNRKHEVYAKDADLASFIDTHVFPGSYEVKDDPRYNDAGLASGVERHTPEQRKKAIFSSPSASPLRHTEELDTKEGINASLTNARNKLSKAFDIAKEGDVILNPWDVIYDWLDKGEGDYNGALINNIRIPLDKLFNDSIKDGKGIPDKDYKPLRKFIKETRKIVKSDKFKDKYGDLGQQLVLEHLKTTASQGAYKHVKILDVLRKLTSRGIISWRIPSQLVHLANIPLAMQRTGVVWWHQGLSEVLGDEGKTFLKQHFGETFTRSGGEPAQAEATEGGPKVSKSRYEKFSDMGFATQRYIDMLNAQATSLGVYMKLLKQKGLDPSKYSTLPVDEALIGRARILARRAVASSLAKDVSPILTRGGSYSRSLFQFQNTFLDQWSNIRYDFAKAGLSKTLRGDPKQALTMALAIGGMLIVETSVKHGYKQGLAALTGSKMKKDDTYEKDLEKEALKRVPGVGQLQSSIMWGGSGIPSIDVVRDAIQGGIKTVKADEKGEKIVEGTRTAASVLETAGVPGTSQVSDIVTGFEKAKYFKNHNERLQAETGKDVSKMSIGERLKAEIKHRKLEKSNPMSESEEEKAAESNKRNNFKRGQELYKKLSKADRGFLESRKLRIPGHDNKLNFTKKDTNLDKAVEVYLTDEETEKYGKELQSGYEKAIKLARKSYDSLGDEDEKSEYWKTLTEMVIERVKDKMKDDLSSSKTELNKKDEKPKKRFSVFSP